MPISLSSARARPTIVTQGIDWHADASAIAQAARELGVTRPVRVIASPFRRGRWGGMHTLLANGVHEIRVATWTNADEASRTLWHELSHAAQSDRGVTGGTTRLRGDAYTYDPREIEARAAEVNHERLALAYPVEGP